MPTDKLIEPILEAQKVFDTRPDSTAIGEVTRASRSIGDRLQSIGENSALKQA